MSQDAALIGYIDKYASEDHYIGTTIRNALMLFGGTPDLAAESYTIRTTEEVFIGRDPDQCRITVDAPWISNIHMRLYSIYYDEGIEPFLYVEDRSSQGNNTWLYKRQSTWERCIMAKGSVVLFSDRDRIRLCDGTILRYRSAYASSASSIDIEQDELRDMEKNALDNIFHITQRQLGAGGSASVYMAVDRWQKEQVACKVVRLKDTPLEQAPNIIRVGRVFSTIHTLYLIEDLITGGDLQSYIDQKMVDQGSVDDKGRLSRIRNDALGTLTSFIRDLLKYHHTAMHVLHLNTHMRYGKLTPESINSIVHRDLKPENVLMSVPAVNARIILTDFGGAACELKANPSRLKSHCGTADWLAPEVRLQSNEGYTKAVDMWSLGCLITALFTGTSLFVNAGEVNFRNPTMAIYLAAAKCDLSPLDTSPLWQDVDPRAKNFTKCLLVLDESTRMTADEGLHHPWFCQGARKKNLEAFYRKVTASWQPTQPVEHFEEDLNVFIDPSLPYHDNRQPPSSQGSPPNKTKCLLEPRSSSLRYSSPTRYSPKDMPKRVRFGSSLLDLELATSERSKTVSSPATFDNDFELRTQAWDGNRGLMTARDYDRKIAEKRLEENA